MSTRSSRSGTKRSAAATDSTDVAKPRKQTKSNASTNKSSSNPENNDDLKESTPRYDEVKVPNEESKEPSKATQATTKNLTITESTGDIFDAPPRTLLVHACNCEGSWGAGIAKAFATKYPDAFDDYKVHCEDNSPAKLISKGHLIHDKDSNHFIGCLFTSRSKGKKKDPPNVILKATRPAMIDLLRHVRQWNESHDEGEKVGEVRMCKINSGLFNVPWEKTKAVLEEIEVVEGDVKELEVISLGE